MRPDEFGHEDIMREAVSLLTRIELKCAASDSLIVLGLNAQEWLSVYLGSDSMYRFDNHGRLRRAFVDGDLFRTSGTTLARLQRTPEQSPVNSMESVLARSELTDQELEAFRARVLTQLKIVHDSLPTAQITRQYPSEDATLRSVFRARLILVLNSAQFLAPAIVRR